jgi:hypothetical protein
MFVGHYSVSFAASRTGVVLPLWVWFVAVQWLDVGFMTLVLTGVEKVRITEGFTESNDLDLYYMPFTHGLVGAVLMSVLFAVIVAAIFPAGRRPVALALVALASFSHWLIDLVMHTPDLPVFDDGSTMLGLGLWDHPAIGLPLELLLLALGAWVYTRAVALTDRGRTLVWGFVALLAVAQLYSHFGPTPTSPEAFAATGLTAYIVLAAAAAWVERRAVDPQAALQHVG